MAATSAKSRHASNAQKLTTHAVALGIYRAFDLFVSSTGHTGVATTLPDFSKWVANLMSPNETIVGPDFLALEDPAYGPVKTGRLSQYVNGLGFHRRSFGHFYGHYGSVAEYKSTFWFEPEKQLAYIQLCNYDFTDEPSKRAIVDGYKVY